MSCPGVYLKTAYNVLCILCRICLSVSQLKGTEKEKRKVYAVRRFNHAMAWLSWEAMDRPKASHPPQKRDSLFRVLGSGPYGGSALCLKKGSSPACRGALKFSSQLDYSMEACDSMCMQDIHQALDSDFLNSKRLG